MKRYLFLGLLVMFFAGSIFAAELKLNLNMQRQTDETLKYAQANGTQQQKRQMKQRKYKAYFVIDCSGSMWNQIDKDDPIAKGNPDVVGEHRINVLQERINERLDVIPEGTEIHVYLLSNCANDVTGDKKDSEWGADFKDGMESRYRYEIKYDLTAADLELIKKAKSVVRNFDTMDGYFLRYEKTITQKSDRTAVQNELEAMVKYIVALNGGTPYYHTLAKSMDKIANDLKDPSIELRLFAYSDGFNFTGNDKTVLFPSTESTLASAAAAKAKFLADSFYGGIWKTLKAKNWFSEEWLGNSDVPDQIAPIPEFTANVLYGADSLKHPKKAPAQDLPATLFFPMSEENWKALQGASAEICLTVAGKVCDKQTITLKNGKSSVSLKLPDTIKDGDFAEIKLNCSCEVKGKFKLSSPAPNKFAFQALDKVVFTGIDVEPGNVVLKGQSARFTANTNADSVEWEFGDGSKASGKEVIHKFNKTGDFSYKATASQEGLAGKISLDGKIKVCAVGIAIEPQDKRIVPDEPDKITAKTLDGCLKPSRYSWVIIANSEKNEIKSKDDKKGSMIRLTDTKSEATHKFLKSGEYTVKVTAYYDDLPLAFSEAETSWFVEEAASMKFAVPDNVHKDFGTQDVELKVETKGELKDIIWCADGKEIGKGVSIIAPVVQAAGKTKRTVVYTVTAKDQNGKIVKPDGEKLTYTYGCSIEPPKEILINDGKQEYGLSDKIAFKLSPASDYDDIVWTVSGEEPMTGNGVGHKPFSTPGEVTYKWSCKCKKCGEQFSGEGHFKIGSQEAKPKFALVPDNASYAKGEKVTLKDKSTGDYKKCIWMYRFAGSEDEFQAYRETEKGGECEIAIGSSDFPVSTFGTDIEFKLKIVDLENHEVETPVKTVRVRTWWLAILVIASIVIILIILGKLLLHNEPMGWKLRYWKNGPQKKDDPKAMRKEGDVERWYSTVNIGFKYWKFLDKKASIPLKALETVGLKQKDPDSERITIDKSTGKPKLELSSAARKIIRSADFGYAKPPLSPHEYKCYGLYLITATEGTEKEQFVRLVLDVRKPNRSLTVLFWLLLIGSIPLAYWLCTMWAF